MPRVRPARLTNRPPRLTRRDLLRAGSGAVAAAALGGCVAPPKKEPAPSGPIAYPPPPEAPRFFYERTITGSADLATDDSTSRLRQLVTGESIRGRGFAKPFDCVAQAGRLYVSDTVDRTVMALDFPSGRFFEVGDSAPGGLRKPLGMSVDGSGRLYVCDGTLARIVVFDADGNYLSSMGGTEQLDRPTSVAVNAEGTRIYAVDTGGVQSRNHRVRIFDAQGQVIHDIGTRGGEPGNFNLPLNAAVHPDGRLFVLDTGNFRVQVFSPEGEFLHAFGQAGRSPGSFSHPKGISIDVDGKVFIADTAFGVVQIFSPEGRVLMDIGQRSNDGGPGRFILPAGVSADIDGRVYVVDQFFRKIDVFREATVPQDWPAGRRKTVAMPPGTS